MSSYSSIDRNARWNSCFVEQLASSNRTVTPTERKRGAELPYKSTTRTGDSSSPETPRGRQEGAGRPVRAAAGAAEERRPPGSRGRGGRREAEGAAERRGGGGGAPLHTTPTTGPSVPVGGGSLAGRVVFFDACWLLWPVAGGAVAAACPAVRPGCGIQIL